MIPMDRPPIRRQPAVDHEYGHVRGETMKTKSEIATERFLSGYN
jgi:hypothetical protein